MHIHDGFMSEIAAVDGDGCWLVSRSVGGATATALKRKNGDVCKRKAQLWPLNVHFLRNQTPEVCATQVDSYGDDCAHIFCRLASEEGRHCIRVNHRYIIVYYLPLIDEYIISSKAVFNLQHCLDKSFC